MGSFVPSVHVNPPSQNETIAGSAKPDENEEKRLCPQACSSCTSLHEPAACAARLKVQF